jgi:hypothetical protein
LRIGDRLRVSIDESIRVHDKLLLVVSASSIGSQWVEHEVESALSRERMDAREVLFPVRLDDMILDVDSGWPSLIRNTRYIGDFSHWTSPAEYERSLDRLLRDLRRTAL